MLIEVYMMLIEGSKALGFTDFEWVYFEFNVQNLTNIANVIGKK